ncbi:hypothetical protein LXL04_008331 [Taraxacum kok-saghyz]
MLAAEKTFSSRLIQLAPNLREIRFKSGETIFEDHKIAVHCSPPCTSPQRFLPTIRNPSLCRQTPHMHTQPNHRHSPPSHHNTEQ